MPPLRLDSCVPVCHRLCACAPPHAHLPSAHASSLPADLATLLIVFTLLVCDRVSYTLGSPLLKAVLHTG